MYAFGVLLWEMMAGCRAWASMKHAQVSLEGDTMSGCLGLVIRWVFRH